MIIPAIDLVKGKVVRLFQGDYQKETLYSDNPEKIFQQWEKEGADYFHLVDLDGAADPKKRQLSLIEKVISNTDTPMQTGGGIRSLDDAKALFSAGVSRIVIGSVAVTNPLEVKRWFDRWGGERIVLALDITMVNGEKRVAINGWKKKTYSTLESVIDDYSDTDLKHILCTDISRDGTLQGANTLLYQQLSNDYPDLLWQASGGVGSIDDISSLKHCGADSVIVGKALLEEKFTVREANRCWQNA